MAMKRESTVLGSESRTADKAASDQTPCIKQLLSQSTTRANYRKKALSYIPTWEFKIFMVRDLHRAL